MNPIIKIKSRVFGDKFVLGVTSKPANDEAQPDIAQLRVLTCSVLIPLNLATSLFNALARIARPMPVLVKKIVARISTNKTTPITNKSKAVNGATSSPMVNPRLLTGVGKPRSSAAQIIPALA